MVVTAWIDSADLQPFTELRRRLFPAERNYLSAHLTLFHQVPAPEREAFVAAAAEEFSTQPSITVDVLPPVSTGRGVAYPVAAAALQAIRAPLRQRFADALGAQDLAPWKRPHITVQNKVDPRVAAETLRELSVQFRPRSIGILGLRYFRYDYGPWTPLGELRFAD